jgi:hypothetical protein
MKPIHYRLSLTALRFSLRLLTVYCCLVVILLSSLYLVLRFTDDAKIISNLKDGRGELVLQKKSMYSHGAANYDIFSECVTLGMNLVGGERDDHPLTSRVLLAPYPTSNDALPAGHSQSDPCTALQTTVQYGFALMSTDYSRFWHGYQIWTRIGLSTVSYTLFRKINASVLLLFSCLLAITLTKHLSAYSAIAFLMIAACFTDLLDLPYLSGQLIPWLITVSSLIFFIIIFSKNTPLRLSTLSIYSFSIGGVFNFTAMFYSPQVLPILLSFFVGTYYLFNVKSTFKYTVWAMLLVVCFWFLGFFSLWGTKWVITSIVFGADSTWPQVFEAASGVNYGADKNLPAVSGLFKSFIFIAKPKILWLLLCCYLVSLLILSVFYFKRRVAACIFLYWIGLNLPSLIIAIAWVAAFRLHSLEHWPFAQKGLIACGIVALLSCNALIKNIKNQPIYSRLRSPTRDHQT